MPEPNVLIRSLTAIEEYLYHTENQSDQDPLNLPIRLNHRLSSLSVRLNLGDFSLK